MSATAAIELTVTPVGRTDVVITGPEALNTWREALRQDVPGHEYTPRFKSGQWDGTWLPGKWCRMRTEDVWELRCSRGLLPRILRAFDCTLDTILVDQADATAYLDGHPNSATLRDYQRQAFAAVLTKGWGRVALATNAGKGAVIAMLADYVRQLGHTVLICCDEVAVFDALEGELEAWAGVTPSLVTRGIKHPPKGPITLAMVPTLSRRLADDQPGWRAWVAQQGMLLLDEADKATAAGWKRVIQNAKNSQWRAGFSGTFPDSVYLDLIMDTLMGPVLEEVRNEELIDRGISAKPLITLYGFDISPALKAAHRNKGERLRPWTYEHGIIHNRARNDYIASLIRPDVPTVIVVNRLDHGRALADTLQGEAMFVDGSFSGEERIRVLDDFAAGGTRILIVTRILDRGTNRLGHAADLIFASAEGSTRQVLQRIGRGLRRAEGKEFLRLVDIVDRVVDDDDDHRLQSAAEYIHGAGRRRAQLYTNEGFMVEVVR